MSAIGLPEQLLQCVSVLQAEVAALQSAQAAAAGEQRRQSEDVAALRSELEALARPVADLRDLQQAAPSGPAPRRPAWTARYAEGHDLAGAVSHDGYDSDSERSDSGPSCAIADLSLRQEKLDKQLEALRVDWAVARRGEAKKWEGFERSVECLREALHHSQMAVPGALREEIAQRCRAEIADAHLRVCAQLTELGQRIDSLAACQLRERPADGRDGLGSLIAKLTRLAGTGPSTDAPSSPELRERTPPGKAASKDASLRSSPRPLSVLSAFTDGKGELGQSSSGEVSISTTDLSSRLSSPGVVAGSDQPSEQTDQQSDRPSDRMSDRLSAAGSAETPSEAGAFAPWRYAQRAVPGSPGPPVAAEGAARLGCDTSAVPGPRSAVGEEWDFLRAWQERKPGWSLQGLPNDRPGVCAAGPWSRMLAS